jgi:hypothetical protein
MNKLSWKFVVKGIDLVVGFYISQVHNLRCRDDETCAYSTLKMMFLYET